MNRPQHTWRCGDSGFPIRDVEFLPDMPRLLLGEGDRPDAFDAPRVAIVGTRAATPLGLADAREMAAFCARAGITVISGLALGIDAAAHVGALDAGGLTVGVVATGLDVVYPRRHTKLYERVRSQGLIVGENAYGTQPLPWRFPIRNRIIAALADAVVVIEATRTGGARITANYGLDYSRDVYALPGSRRNPAAAGCNELIRDGANPLLDPSDVLFAVGRGAATRAEWTRAAPPPDPDERAVLKALAGEPATVDDIERRVDFGVERVGPALRGLERSGRVKRSRGYWWPQ